MLEKGSNDQWISFFGKKYEELDVSCLQGKMTQNITQISMWGCQLNQQKHAQFFRRLPVSSIISLQLWDIKENVHLGFLKMNKFYALKDLRIRRCLISSEGCKNIAEAFLPNLRMLDNDQNPIGDRGCYYLSTANWPFLGWLSLHDCWIGNEGLAFFQQSKLPNLKGISFGGNSNEIDNKLSDALQKLDFPRIQQCVIRFSFINRHGFSFLKLNWWRSLTHLDLYESNVGNKGCKIIKEANFSLRILSLSRCSFDSTGVKWLCKASLKKIRILRLYKDRIGLKGSFYLSRAKMPKLQAIDLQGTEIGVMGLKYLLNTEWSGVAMDYLSDKASKMVSNIDKDIEKIFEGRLKTKI